MDRAQVAESSGAGNLSLDLSAGQCSGQRGSPCKGPGAGRRLGLAWRPVWADAQGTQRAAEG